MTSLRLLVPGLTVLILSCSLLRGDDPKNTGKKAPLPAKWSRLGLSDDQKQKVRAIRGDYAARIEALRLQISKLQKEEKIELYKVLTEGQKKRLRELASDEPVTEEQISTSKPGSDKK